MTQVLGAQSASPGTPGEGRGEGDFADRKSLDVRKHPHPNPLPEYRERGPNILRAIAIPIFLIVLCWYAHFSRSRDFGFYEDDHGFVVVTMVWQPKNLWMRVVEQATHFGWFQGRPVGFVLGSVLPYLGYKIGGVQGMYWIGFAILSINSNLLYFLLRRCFAEPIPIIAAVGYLLYPLDATRPFLTHATILQPAMLFVLVACHLFMNDKRWQFALAYLFVLMALMSYESAVLPMVFFPLLMKRWDLRWLLRFTAHGLALLVVIGGVMLVRHHAGEERAQAVMKTDRHQLWTTIQDGTRDGLQTIDHYSKSRAKDAIDSAVLQPRVRRGMVVCGVSLFGSMVWAVVGVSRRRNYWLFYPDLVRAALYSAASLAIAYTMSFTHFPPTYFEGRLTSVHFAAAVPWAVLVATALSLPMLFPPRAWGAFMSGGLAAIYFTLLFRNAQIEQEGYAAIWDARRSFWTQLVRLCPDVVDGTVVVVNGGANRPAGYMESVSWSEFLVMGQLFDFGPSHFKRSPFTVCHRPVPATGNPTWMTDITHQPDGTFSWNPAPDMSRGPLEIAPGNVILLHNNAAGKLVRDIGTIQLAGFPFKLKDPKPGSGSYPKLPLFDFMIRP